MDNIGTIEDTKMVLEKFDLTSWRKGLPKKTSKLEAARKLGLGKNAYNKYEGDGMCPRYIKLAAMMIRQYEG